jgi:hypothetical protein
MNSLECTLLFLEIFNAISHLRMNFLLHYFFKIKRKISGASGCLAEWQVCGFVGQPSIGGGTGDLV